MGTANGRALAWLFLGQAIALVACVPSRHLARCTSTDELVARVSRLQAVEWNTLSWDAAKEWRATADRAGLQASRRELIVDGVCYCCESLVFVRSRNGTDELRAI